MEPRFKIAATVPDAQASVHTMHCSAQALQADHPVITSGRFELRCVPGAGFEAHLELCLPQRQVLVNGAALTAEAAVDRAVAAAARELTRLEQPRGS